MARWTSWDGDEGNVQSGALIEIYMGSDDIGTEWIECTVCRKRAQLAEGTTLPDPPKDIDPKFLALSCSPVCRSVQEYIWSVKYANVK